MDTGKKRWYAVWILGIFLVLLGGCGKEEEDTIVLRVNNWAEKN